MGVVRHSSAGAHTLAARLMAERASEWWGNLRALTADLSGTFASNALPRLPEGIAHEVGAVVIDASLHGDGGRYSHDSRVPPTRDSPLSMFGRPM